MARKTTKVSPIQTVVDAYANGITRRSDLKARTQKNDALVSASGGELVAHVKASGAIGRVAYQAKTGQTLLVSPTSMAAHWGNPIEVIEPGAQKLPPQEPKADYSELEARIAAALKAGQLNAAGELLSNAVTEENKAASTQSKGLTATGLQYGGRLIDDMVQREMAGKSAMLSLLYGSKAPHFYRGFDVVKIPTPRVPPISQSPYKSAVLGPIPVSQKAKSLFLVEREAISTALKAGDYNAKGMQVSRARGHIAEYISELEQKVNKLQAQIDDGYATRA